MKFSLSTFVFYRYSLTSAIEHIAKLGFHGVEIWGGRPHSYYEDMDEKRINRILKLMNDLRITISNYIPAQFRYPCNLGTLDTQIRTNSVQYIKENIDIAEELGSPYVSLCPGYALNNENIQDAKTVLRETLQELIKYVDDKNIKIIIEPAHAMETNLILTVDQGLEFVGSIGKDKLGLCIDTGHIAVNKESLSDIVEKVQGYDVHYHIDDNNLNSDDHLVMGDGSINFEVFLQELYKSKYSGFLAVELGWGYTADPISASKRSLDFLISKTKKWGVI